MVGVFCFSVVAVGVLRVQCDCGFVPRSQKVYEELGVGDGCGG